jgi:hypothetical protein
VYWDGADARLVAASAQRLSAPPLAPTRHLRRVEAHVRRFVSNRARACAFVFFFTIVVRLALLPGHPFPSPYIQDEYSYLLGADTFASGHLTNPPHPMWKFFETFQTLQQPTYQSKYPPAQALFLACGQVLFGHPWFGVLLATALMCAAACWMLQAWVPSYFAFIGGMALALHAGVASYWVNSYWGGSVAAFGGCLVLGAMRRLMVRPNAWNPLAAALGIAILLNSRPYEGLLLIIAAAFALLLWIRVEGRRWKNLFRVKTLAPALAVLAAVVTFMLYYNSRVTGSCWIPPWEAHERQYAIASPFRFVPLRPTPVYRHKPMRDFWVGVESDFMHEANTHPLRQFARDTGRAVEFFPGVSLLWIPLLVFPWALKRRDARFVALMTALFWCGMALEKGFFPHYPSPGIGLALLMVVYGLRYLRLFHRRTMREGVTLVRCIVLLCLLAPFLSATWYPRDSDQVRPQYTIRNQIAGRLVPQFGPALVVVRYSPKHVLWDEFVYNRADIDHSDVVWARDLGDLENRQLLDYFHGRSAWLLEPDLQPLRLTPYRP